jgi:hypothetical protein
VVIEDSTVVLDKFHWALSPELISHLKEDSNRAPKWIEWSSLSKNLNELRNCRSIIHSRILVVSGEVNIVPRDTLQSILYGDSGWHSFYRRFPGAFGKIQLSRVGFNSDSSQAVVYTAHVAAWTVGSGTYWFLRRKYGRWILEWRYNTWVS